MNGVVVVAEQLSHAWRDATMQLMKQPGREAFHTFVKITNPVVEQDDIWRALDASLAKRDLFGIDTVANTIFPAALAASCSSHEELVERYREIYPVITKRLQRNRYGTYFGRLVAYPAGDEPFDQLGKVIRNLQTELAGGPTGTGHPKQARYETSVVLPEDHDVSAVATSIYVPGKDNQVMDFPCMSHCSFQIDSSRRVHLLAQYRSQHMIQRAFGNYVGLSRLLTYISDQVGAEAGQLSVVAGKAAVEIRLNSDLLNLLQHGDGLF